MKILGKSANFKVAGAILARLFYPRSMWTKMFEIYLGVVFKHPVKVLLMLALLGLLLGWQSSRFRLDASADSLVREGDSDLEFSREINARYGTSDFLFIVYTPAGELFSLPVLETLRALRDELGMLERITSVDSLFEVPLFKVADASLSDVASTIVTLEDIPRDISLDAVREDLLGNQAYRDVLLSEDGTSAALIVNFATNTSLDTLLAERTRLRREQEMGALDAVGNVRLAEVEQAYASGKTLAAANLHSDIGFIRAILEPYRSNADIAMGGVPMIADDLISFVRSDLEKFGIAIVLFIVTALAFLFRQLRFVLIPLACALLLTVCMVGLLGLLDWPVTVISSNFISLLLIITVSLTVHLIVRYRELAAEEPDSTHLQRLRATLSSMLLPCAYTSLTTIVAFASLVTSDIPPIIDFGWMMVTGVLLSFMLSFLLFPALMALLPTDRVAARGHGLDITPAIGRFTERHGGKVLASSFFLLAISVLGIQQLRVENSFIEYFNKDTDIYRGMVTIDTRMGGTTPLEVIVDLARPNPFADPGSVVAQDGFVDEFEWEEDEGDAASDPDTYWFTSDKMARIVAMHDWLDSLPETGKVLSLGTLLKLAYELNDNRELSSIELGVLYNRIPAEYKATLLRPYVSVADDQVRFSVRVRETDPSLVRSRLLAAISDGLQQQFGLDASQIRLTGMLVLYNNMLQSLFESQIMTLSLVMLVIFVMFIILFRSLKLALLGIFPNLLAALTVLGLMGWAGIPLDMMTITIAAISVGIGVDNTIHYIHRFKSNFSRLGSYRATMHYCHGSIGKAMYYTSFTIVVGFSILVLSNFVPTLYFGLLTSLAMLLALVGSLTLLPQLLLTFQPLGKETGRHEGETE